MEKHAEMVIPQDHQSIFSDTYHGVPSPTIPHEHPYPTRFHGPIYSYPRFFRPYRQQSMTVPTGYVGAASHQPVSGLGAITLPSATGNSVLDALFGAGVGYVAAKSENDKLLWTALGAAAGLVFGTYGIAGVVGAALYTRA